MSARVILQVTTGPIRGRQFTLDLHETFLCGRHRSCHAQIAGDGLVSRHHFLIEANPPQARLRDLGSLNGTFVNDRRYCGRDAELTDGAASQAEIDLNNGDEIKVGNTTIVVQVVLTTTCAECGVEIPAESREESSRADNTFVCRPCRSQLETSQPFSAEQEARVTTWIKTGGPADSTRPVIVHCEQCRQEIAVDSPNARGGRIICEACRARSLSQQAPPRELVDQLQLNDYQFEKLLGRGGEGAVFLARRNHDEAEVAIKFLLSRVAVEEDGRKAFLREVEIARRLEHAHIVSLLGNGGDGGAFYFIMEYCNGGNLAQLLKRRGGKLPVSAALPFMSHCLAGLDYAHRANVVHRDIKPQNILLEQSVRGWVAKIGDLGLAKNFELAGFSGMTTTGTVGGTVYYMPREQITQYRYVRPASDVWSMAATFYFMLAGTYPLDFPKGRDPMEVVLQDEPTPLAQRGCEVPPAIAGVIDQALAMDADRRFANAAEMRAALQEAAREARLT